MHNAVSPNLGTSAAIVAVTAEAGPSSKPEVLENLGRRLAMHVVASQPKYLSPATVPKPVIEREKEIIREQTKGTGKPEKIVEKITEGRVAKFLAEISLLEQPHMVEEDNPKVGEFLKKVSKQLGGKVEVTNFVFYKCGEKELESEQN